MVQLFFKVVILLVWQLRLEKKEITKRRKSKNQKNCSGNQTHDHTDGNMPNVLLSFHFNMRFLEVYFCVLQLLICMRDLELKQQ